MAQTMRSLVAREFEDRLVAVIDCLDCGAHRGDRCRNAHGKEVVRVCWARHAFGLPLLQAQAHFALLLSMFGVGLDVR